MPMRMRALPTQRACRVQGETHTQGLWQALHTAGGCTVLPMALSRHSVLTSISSPTTAWEACCLSQSEFPGEGFLLLMEQFPVKLLFPQG